MSRPLQAALARLLQTESGQLAASKLTPAQCRALDNFRARTGAIQQQRSGRGVLYRIADRNIAEQHYYELTPLQNDALDATLPLRAANIGRSRSSKAGRYGHEIYYLLLKARGPVTWHSPHSSPLDLQQATQDNGAAVFCIGGDSDQHWYSESELWLVENQALFDRLDWLPGTNAATVAWYSGHLRNCLLDWLAERPRASQIRLFPDYDGVGLANYQRIRERLGTQVSFWLMPDWEDRLRRFGTNVLWQNSAEQFERALIALQPQLAQEPALQYLLQSMQSLGLALEQEAVWL